MSTTTTYAEVAEGIRATIAAYAHALDDASTALIHHLLAEDLCQLVLAFRSGEHLVEPLARLAAEHENRVTVGLAPLSAHDARQAAELGLGGQLDDEVAQRIVDLAQGHPLLLHELVVGAVESGSLRHVAGRWLAEGSLATSSRLTAVKPAVKPGNQLRSFSDLIMNRAAVRASMPSITTM